MILNSRVRHHIFGDGVVEAVTVRGGVSYAQVNFEYMTDWLPEGDLITAADTHESQLGVELPQREELLPNWQSLTRLCDSVVSARRAVLALRLGQVLRDRVAGLSVGTEDARAKLEQAVSSASKSSPRTILVKGPYGGGKTHLLTMLAALAAKMEFATASVILDGEGVTLSNPCSILQQILRSLCFPGESVPVGVGRRLENLCKSGGPWPGGRLRRSRIGEAMSLLPSEAWDDSDVVETLEDYLTTTLATTHAKNKLRDLLGYRIDLPTMTERLVRNRSAWFREMLLDWVDVCVASGAKGLAIVIDELDVDYALDGLSSEGSRRRRLFLDGLSDILLEPIPLVMAFGSAPDPDSDVRREGGLPLEFDDQGNLSAYTQKCWSQAAAYDAVHDLTRALKEIQQVVVPKPDRSEMLELARRLVSLYKEAYPHRSSRIDEQTIATVVDDHERSLDPPIRRFVRGLLERMDVAEDL